MIVNGIPKLYRFFDNRDRFLCEVIALTYDEAYEKAVAKAGSELPLRPDFFIEILKGDEQTNKRETSRKCAPVVAIKGTGLLARFFSKSRQ